MKAGDNSQSGWRRRGRPRYAGALTPRQQDVFELLVTGLTNEEIAQHLGIAPNSVKYHVSEILQRLGVDNRHDAVALYRTQGSGWLAGLAPVMFFRKLSFVSLPKAAAGAVFAATTAGIAVVAWGALPISTVATTPMGCAIERTLSSAPACAPATPQQVPAGPQPGARLADGLLSPGGMTMGPDGMLYVAEAGIGGSTKVTTAGVDVGTTGGTGRISKIDPGSGARTTVIDGLPNFSHMGWDASGPADVAFLGTQLYYLHTFGGAEFGLPDTPTGIYKVTNGTATIFADIDAFNAVNPPLTYVLDGSGNSITAQNGAFYVVDSLEHAALKVTAAGVISRPDGVTNVEPTRVTLSGRGPFYVNSIATFPHAPEVAGVYSFPDPAGNLVVAAHDLDLTDVEVGPGGQYVHALWIGGNVLKAGATGMMSVVVDGFPDAAGLIFDGDTAYFQTGRPDWTGSISGAQLWKITGFSSVTSPALPNTGTGPARGGDAAPWAIALATAVLGAVSVGGGAVATRRR